MRINNLLSPLRPRACVAGSNPLSTFLRWIASVASSFAMTLIIGSTLAQAASDLYTFTTPEKQARFQHVLSELRCLVCQNQTLADSNAPVAQDLRREVAKLVEKYDTDQQVVDFLVQRYGDFVLYNPPMTKTTYILWLGPFILLLIGFIVIFFIVRRGHAAKLIRATFSIFTHACSNVRQKCPMRAAAVR